MEYITRDSELLIEGIRIPPLRTRLEGRHALVVARGYRHSEDLQALHAYIREFKPVMIGVDGGANALLDAGYRPDLIVGDMDSVSDRALNCGAEIVVHAYPNGYAPGPAAGAGPRPGVGDLPGQRHQRGRRGADGRRGRGHPDRRGRDAILAGRVPRQGPVRHGQRRPDPDPGGRQNRRRQGGQPAYQSRISGWALVLLALAALVTLVVAMLSLPLRHVYLEYLSVVLQPREALANWTLLVIDFRYHLVSIIAVFLALAIGLAIGANLLPQATEAALQRIATRVTDANDRLTKQNTTLKQQISADQTFAQASASRLLGHLLTGQSVVLVTAPGADSQVLSGVTAAVSRPAARSPARCRCSRSSSTPARAPSRTSSRSPRPRRPTPGWPCPPSHRRPGRPASRRRRRSSRPRWWPRTASA